MRNDEKIDINLTIEETHDNLSEEELAQQNITPATIRLSIGVEHIDDIIADIEQALEKV